MERLILGIIIIAVATLTAFWDFQSLGLSQMLVWTHGDSFTYSIVAKRKIYMGGSFSISVRNLVTITPSSPILINPVNRLSSFSENPP